MENLGREVTEDDRRTRLKEDLIDRRYSQLAHSLYTANDMTYTRASSLIKGYESTSFGKHAMQKSGKDDVNTAMDDSKWKVHKSKGRYNKCKKLGHFAREGKTPEFIIQKMKGNSRAQKRDHRNREDTKPKVPVCDICDVPGHTPKIAST